MMYMDAMLTVANFVEELIAKGRRLYSTWKIIPFECEIAIQLPRQDKKQFFFQRWDRRVMNRKWQRRGRCPIKSPWLLKCIRYNKFKQKQRRKWG
jgi:hypothetical protein